VFGEATVLEMMIFVGATVLRASVLERMCIGATVLEVTVLFETTALKATVPVEIYGIVGATMLRATVLEATVLVGATVLGGRPRECG
jgi:hypothetical protein